MMPKNITKDHLLSAINDIRKDPEIRKGRASSTYDVVFENECYPPKLIISLANKHANGKELDHNLFDGGVDTPAFKILEKYGFSIIKKGNKLKLYLHEFSEIAEDWFNEQQWLEENFQFYISFFQEKKIEKYEWSDFQKLGDYIHSFNSLELAKKRALGNPNLPIERYREIFKYIVTTNDEINVVINNLLDTEKYKLPYFGDSAISELIGYAYPDQYVFYNSRDEWAIQEIGINFSKKRAEKFGDKFIRYNQSITNVIEQYIEIVGQKTNTSVCLEVDQFFSWIYTTKQKGSSINKMIDSYKEIIKESKLEGEIYKWTLVKENNGVSNLATENFVEEINKLKFGNMAYQMALPVLKRISEDSPEKLKEIFIYLFDESIDIDTRVEHYIKSCKKIYKGENQTHQDTRTAATLLTFLNPNNYTFYKSTTYEKYCKLINVKKEKREKRYSHYLNLLKDLSDNYISKDKELLNMKESFLGKDLCNYDKNNMIIAQDILNEVLVKEEKHMDKLKIKYWIYSPGEDACKWQEFKTKSIIGLGWDELGDLREFGSDKSAKSKIKKKLQQFDPDNGSKKNDGLANFEFVNVMDIGDIVLVKKGSDDLLGYGEVISDYYYDQSRDEYKSVRDMKWIKSGEWLVPEKMFDIKRFVQKTLTDITKYPGYPQGLINIMNGEIPKEQIIMKKPINKILFGPPGTGKTYKLSHKYFEEYTTTQSSLTRIELLENLIREKKYTWFDVITSIIKMEGTSKVSEISKHELILAKTNVSDTKTVKSTIWGQLQSHTDIECKNVNTSRRREPQIMWKNDDSSWKFIDDDIDDLIDESLELINEFKDIEDSRISNKLIKRYEFVTFHQAFSYEDFIEGIKPVMDEETDELKYEIKPGVFKEICNRAKKDPENKYALFIDEINRGNVANIFGELITLIEPDKRAGMDNALSVKLPYSKTIFSVPNNLDIIGTMNTADRSVEALDTALRRRFEFEEMLPNSSLLSDIRCEGINFEYLLNTINGRIEKLLDKDHQIGHSYFMNSRSELSIEDLQGIFKNKIMPLLQEYFYGDFGKIGLVLGKSFIKVSPQKIDFSEFTYDDRDLIDERKVYQLSDLDNLSAADVKSIYEKSE